MIAPKATITRVVLLSTPGIARTRNANRRASPLASIAWAMMNAPMKTRIVVEPNGAITSSAGATPISTITAIPSRPPIGIGIASEIQSTITNSSAAASFCWSACMSSGSSRKITKHRRREEQPDRAAGLLEALLGGAQLLLAERAVGAGAGDPLQRVAVRFPLLAHPRATSALVSGSQNSR